MKANEGWENGAFTEMHKKRAIPSGMTKLRYGLVLIQMRGTLLSVTHCSSLSSSAKSGRLGVIMREWNSNRKAWTGQAYEAVMKVSKELSQALEDYAEGRGERAVFVIHGNPAGGVAWDILPLKLA